MPVTDKVTVRVGLDLLRQARECLAAVTGPFPNDGHMLRAGLYALMELSPDKQAEMMKRAELRRGWPQREGADNG